MICVEELTVCPLYYVIDTSVQFLLNVLPPPNKVPPSPRCMKAVFTNQTRPIRYWAKDGFYLTHGATWGETNLSFDQFWHAWVSTNTFSHLYPPTLYRQYYTTQLFTLWFTGCCDRTGKKFRNKLGLSWAKFSSSLYWALLLLICIKLK